MKVIDKIASLVERAGYGDKKIIFGSILFAWMISFISFIILNQGLIDKSGRVGELTLVIEFSLWLGLLLSWLFRYTNFKI